MLLKGFFMQEIAISKFKATCLAVLEKVSKTGEAILVTRFGKPIARIEPPAQVLQPRKLGLLAGTMKIHGDIVGSITDISDWEAGQDPEDEPK
jgi:antitoxin (DNA-binding transcriptional repressor) of toxin-antitoxin stability system